MSIAKATAKTKEKKTAKTAAKTTAKAASDKAAEKSAPSPKFDQERLMTVLLAPTISEKATQIADKHAQVTFRVAQNATKPEVKAAVELMFKVEVDSVQIANVRGKAKRFGAYAGRRRNWKKAYVCLKAGQEINFAQEA